MKELSPEENKKLNDFARGAWDLVILLDEVIIYHSDKEDLSGQGIKPVVDFIRKFGTSLKNVVIYDKIVGQAVALLFVFLKVKKVYGVLGSEKAEKVLKKYQIPYLFLKIVPYISNRDKTGPCPFEIKAERKTPEEFWKMVSEEC